MSNFLELVKAERQKQINKHGYTPEHDDEHTDGLIADAGACYAATSLEVLNLTWEWHPDYFTKQDHDRKQQLIITAAFINAEYDRLVRAEQKATVHLCKDCNLSFHNCKSNHKFGTGIENDNVYECDTFTRIPYQMPCPYGFDSMEHQIEEIQFAHHLYQKILDRTKIRTARKQDKSGYFSITGKLFKAEFEVALTMPAFISLFYSYFYTPEQFGFESSQDMWDYYDNYFEDLVYVHKISEVQS